MIPMKSMAELAGLARAKGPARIALAAADDDDALRAVDSACKDGMASAMLVGDPKKIADVAGRAGIDLAPYEIIDEPDPARAALKASALVSSGKATVLMKGLVDSASYLKAALDPDVGLRTGKTLCSVVLVEVPGFDRLLLLSDAAMNPVPSIEVKKDMIAACASVARAMGCTEPRVALIGASEKPDAKMPASLEAAELQKLAEAGLFPGCKVAGPMGLDLALSAESARHKGYANEVGGTADILILPGIESANVLVKAMMYLAKAAGAGVVLGAKAPIVMTSRSDSARDKASSIALAILMSGYKV